MSINGAACIIIATIETTGHLCIAAVVVHKRLIHIAGIATVYTIGTAEDVVGKNS